MRAWCQSYLSSRNTSVNLYELEMELEVRREWSRLLKSFVFWMWKIEPEEEREATWRKEPHQGPEQRAPGWSPSVGPCTPSPAGAGGPSGKSLGVVHCTGVTC